MKKIAKFLFYLMIMFIIISDYRNFVIIREPEIYEILSYGTENTNDNGRIEKFYVVRFLPKNQKKLVDFMDKHFEQNKDMFNDSYKNVAEIRRAYYNESNGLSLYKMYTKHENIQHYFNFEYRESYKNDIEESLKYYLTGQSYASIDKNIVYFQTMKRGVFDGQPYDDYDQEKKIFK